MASPGSTVYQIIAVQLNAVTRRAVAQVQLSVMDVAGIPQPTRIVGVRLPWSADLFSSVQSAIATTVAADPQLAGVALL
jgi:hypothetical protein